MKTVIFFLILCIITLNSFAQTYTYRSGDKFVFTNSIAINNREVAYHTEGVDFNTNKIWVIAKIDTLFTTEIMFSSGKDSFWIQAAKLPNELENFRGYTLKDFNKYLKLYGPKKMKDIFSFKTWFGMSLDQLEMIYGKDYERNCTYSKYGSFCQIIYGKYSKSYYYFRDDKLESYQ